MFWIEYAWYGAGATRFGFWIDGEPVIAHQVGWGNYVSPAGVGQTQPWSRTGNLPVRYEQRNTGTIAQANDLFHYGVSVLVEGGQDDQRGFTYSYGMDPIVPVRAVTMAASSPVRKPVLSIRSKAMGLVEYSQASTGSSVAGTTGSTTGTVTGGSTTTLVVGGAAWVVDYWKGRYVYLLGLAGQGGTGSIARIVSNTATTLTLVDNVTGLALTNSTSTVTSYSIGLLNRGQLLPKKLYVVQTTASVNCTIEIVASTPTSPVVLSGASFVALSGIGSANSFAERDVSATAMTGGEVTFAFPLNAGAGIQEIDLSYFFPMLNTIRGNQMDILTVSIAGPVNTAYTVGASLICQEAMS
jgi:hypothetical protein